MSPATLKAGRADLQRITDMYLKDPRIRENIKCFQDMAIRNRAARLIRESGAVTAMEKCAVLLARTSWSEATIKVVISELDRGSLYEDTD